ncbi:hypothetical protein DDZ14_03150 [Maritimibacter sp. 55A14]|uniref:alpha/beta hydrolase n=1 Tax=Maritimibacter sp. 55A14 TaxID=2174844 RepID=UPI000D61BC0F|nr:alpha/beta hydrolase [Maritimibacter sp. 55A14]PWE33679.1 hypothetical protein DDZ14_03150 [Maritimibacter sp. 55A14]
MALLQVNTRDGGLRLRGGGGHHWEAGIARTLAQTPPDAPVAVMIHGLKFSPFDGAADPHRHIFAIRPDPGCRKARSWPAGMGFSAEGHADGFCIAFGWDAAARNRPAEVGAAYARAAEAGAALSHLLETLAALAPGRRVDALAHSMGCHVLLTAMGALRRPVLGRAILMGAADYARTAQTALANHAASGAEIFNITSESNAFYDLLFRSFVRPPAHGARTLGCGLPDAPRRWVDVPIDCPQTLAALGRRGVAIAPPTRRVCHWGFYLRPGIFGLYNAILRQRDGWSAPALRAALTPRAEPQAAWRPAAAGATPA